MSKYLEKVYVPQWYSEHSEEWHSYTKKSGNALHKTYNQAYKKVWNGGRVITYSLVEDNIEYIEATK